MFYDIGSFHLLSDLAQHHCRLLGDSKCFYKQKAFTFFPYCYLLKGKKWKKEKKTLPSYWSTTQALCFEKMLNLFRPNWRKHSDSFHLTWNMPKDKGSTAEPADHKVTACPWSRTEWPSLWLQNSEGRGKSEAETTRGYRASSTPTWAILQDRFSNKTNQNVAEEPLFLALWLIQILQMLCALKSRERKLFSLWRQDHTWILPLSPLGLSICLVKISLYEN